MSITEVSAEAAAPGFSETAAYEPAKASACSECTGIDWTRDPTIDLDRPLHGWPQLSRLMTQHPQFATFQRFRDLNIKNLLYYQGELDALRWKLNQVEWRDHQERQVDGASDFSSDIGALLLSEDSPDLNAKEQRSLVKKLRVVLREYNEAMLQFSQVSAMREPEPFNVDSLRSWMIHCNLPIHGPGATTWGDLNRIENSRPVSIFVEILRLIKSAIWPQKRSKFPSTFDLVAPVLSTEIDPFTRWLVTSFIPVYNRFRNLRQKHGYDEEAQPPRQDELSTIVRPTLVTYRASSIIGLISSMSTMLTCLLPAIAITILAQLHSLRDLILCLLGFTALFAMAIPYLSKDKRSKMDIFTASAIFSAVLVVFIPVRLQ